MKLRWAVLLVGMLSVLSCPVFAAPSKNTYATYNTDVTLRDLLSESLRITLPETILPKGDRIKKVNIANGDCIAAKLAEGVSIHDDHTIEYKVKPFTDGKDTFCYEATTKGGVVKIGRVNLDIELPKTGRHILRGDVWIDYNLDYKQNDNPHNHDRSGWNIYVWSIGLMTGKISLFGKTRTEGDYGIWEMRNVPLGRYVVTAEVQPGYTGNTYRPIRPYSYLTLDVLSDPLVGCNDSSTDKLNLCLFDDNNFKMVKALHARDDDLQIDIDKIGETTTSDVKVLDNDLGPNGVDGKMLAVDGINTQCSPTLGRATRNDYSQDVGANRETYHSVSYDTYPGSYGHDTICYKIDTSYQRTLVIEKAKERARRVSRSSLDDLTDPEKYFSRVAALDNEAKINVTIKPKETAEIQGVAYVDRNLNKQKDDNESLTTGAVNLETDYFQRMYSEPRTKSVPIVDGKFAFKKLPAGDLDYSMTANDTGLVSDKQTFRIANPNDVVNKEVRLWHPAVIKDRNIDLNVDNISKSQEYSLNLLSSQRGSNGVNDDRLIINSVLDTDECRRPTGNFKISSDGKRVNYTLPANYNKNTVTFCYGIKNSYTGESYVARAILNLRVAHDSTIKGVLYLNRSLISDNAVMSNYALANTKVVLLDADNHEVAASTTDNNGQYNFSGLAAGVYHVALDDETIALNGNIRYTKNIQSGRKVGVFSKYNNFYAKGEVWKD